MKRTAIVLAIFLLGAKVGEYGERQLHEGRESAAADAEIESFRSELRARQLICSPSLSLAAPSPPGTP